MSEDTAARAYRELAGLVFADRSLTATLSRVAELTKDAVPGADDVSVTLIESGRARTVAFAGDSKLAAVLDERQYRDGFGPCLDAAASARTIEVADTSLPHEIYPEFAALARREGVWHTLSVGLPTAHDVSGGLNIYGHGTDGPFTPEAKAAAAGFAGYVAVAITNISLYHGAIEKVTQMQQAMASRAVIEQAKGILMNVKGVDEEAAFELLRKASSHSNRKLRDIARAIVDGAVRPD
jgi:GAF domain-containing protein